MRRLTLALVLLTGCDLYWGTGDPPPCQYGYGADGGALVWGGPDLRNPTTGQCEVVGGGQPPCDSQCGPCPLTDVPVQPQPDWGVCSGACEALGPDDCLVTAGCRAAYNQDSSNALTDFLGCWETAPSGPIEGGACTGLDAYNCSRHDDCSAVYSPNGFVSCQPEPSANGCAAVDCGPGSHCEEQCAPCGPTADCAGTSVCQSMCVPDQPSCANVDCGPGFTCAVVCDPMNPTPGTGTGCGQCGPQCVPVDQPALCEQLATEGECSARTDCTPVYDGQDCTCYPGYCECNILTYERCESTVPTP